MTRKESDLSDELLQRYFDEELPAAERAGVEARLDADARLRLDALRELRTLLHASVTADRTDLSSMSAAIDAIERAPAASTSARGRRAWLPVSAAGGFLAAAAAMIFFLMPVDRPAPTNEADVEMLEVQGAVATVFRMEDHENPTQTATVIWADDEESSTNAPPQGKVQE